MAYNLCYSFQSSIVKTTMFLSPWNFWTEFNFLFLQTNAVYSLPTLSLFIYSICWGSRDSLPGADRPRGGDPADWRQRDRPRDQTDQSVWWLWHRGIRYRSFQYQGNFCKISVFYDKNIIFITSILWLVVHFHWIFGTQYTNWGEIFSYSALCIYSLM